MPGWLGMTTVPLVFLGTSLQMLNVNSAAGSMLSCSHEPQRWMSVTGPVFAHMKSSASTRGWPAAGLRVAFTSRPPGTRGCWANLTPLVSGQHGGGGGSFVGVVTLNAILKGLPKGSIIVFHAAGMGPAPQTAVSL